MIVYSVILHFVADIADYMSFWISSIKTYASGKVKGLPRIMIVGTHLDKIKKVQFKDSESHICIHIKYNQGANRRVGFYMEHRRHG